MCYVVLKVSRYRTKSLVPSYHIFYVLQINLENVQADAYLVVFSIAHRDTFDVSLDLLSELRMDLGTDRPIVLVGNKLDLVRKRKVKTEGICTCVKCYSTQLKRKLYRNTSLN